MEINIEGMINKLEYDVNEFIIRNAELKKLKGLKDKLEAIYSCELRKGLLQLAFNNRDNEKIAQLRLNRDLAIIRYYLMKSYIEDIKFEIEVLISMLIWLTINFSAIKGEEVRGLN